MRFALYSPFLLAACLLLACTSESVPEPGAGPTSATSGAPDTDEEKILNALGQALAQNVVPAGLSADELAFVQRGLSDAVLGRDPLANLNEYGPKKSGVR